MAKSQAQLLTQEKENTLKSIEECQAKLLELNEDLKRIETQLKIADILEHPEKLEEYIKAEAQKLVSAETPGKGGRIDRSILKTKALEIVDKTTSDFKVQDIVDQLFESLSNEEQTLHPKDVVKQTLTVWLPKQKDLVKATGIRGMFRKI